MKTEIFEFAGYGETTLPACLWMPEGEVKAILLISGQDDPVGNGGKGVRELYDRMKKAGLETVTLKLFPRARHDLLHEEKNGGAEARKLIAEWIEL